MIKRISDILISSILLVLISPFFLIVALYIRFVNHIPPIYKQERIGQFGKPFTIYKFRTMAMNAESDTPILSLPKCINDGRLTKFGRYLRTHHLDEFPQLWNVLRGDMSLVGYRPERKYFIDMIMKNNPRYEELYCIRPGVTSYATIYNGYTDTMEKMLKRLEYDIYYLEHRSVWLDIRILYITSWKIISGESF